MATAIGNIRHRRAGAGGDKQKRKHHPDYRDRKRWRDSAKQRGHRKQSRTCEQTTATSEDISQTLSCHDQRGDIFYFHFPRLYSGPLFSISISFGASFSSAWSRDLISRIENPATARSTTPPTAK